MTRDIRVLAAMALIIAAVPMAGCASGGGAPETSSTTGGGPRVLSQIEMTTFSPSLDVQLDSMTKHPSGLYIQDFATGTGPVATRGKTVVVRYKGFLPDGTLFDGGPDGSEITFTLGSNRTIKAWEEGLLGMRVGGQRRLIVPPHLGYGSQGAGPIPPNSVLVFDVQLIALQ